MRSVRLACGQGFYGDSLRPSIRVLENGGIDFLCFDALAELTLAILSKDRMKNPALGYTKDLPEMMMELVSLARRNGTVIITNGGGLNPSAAATAIVAAARNQGITGLKVAYAEGDDVLGSLDQWQRDGIELVDMETGSPFSALPKNPLFANVYLGSDCIVQALEHAPDIVVTGRTTDAAAYLAPAMHRLGFARDDWDRLAMATIAGHLLECGGQGSGGNFSGDWWNVENLHDIGYPIAEIFEDGSVFITKSPGTGGRISRDVLKEQLFYEIHDPATYLTPDVIADLRDADLVDIDENRVQLTGVKGRPAPETLKLVAGLPGGWMAVGHISYSWPYALEKAKRASGIIRQRVATENICFEAMETEFIGVNSLGGPTAPIPETDAMNEVVLRVAVSCQNYADAVAFRKLFPPLYINSFPFVGGLRNMLHVGSLLDQWSCVVPRDLVEANIRTGMVVS